MSKPIVLTKKLLILVAAETHIMLGEYWQGASGTSVTFSLLFALPRILLLIS